MISINNVTVSFSGAGKSTLLKTIIGIQPIDKGSITIPEDCTVGYLPQQMELPSERTVIEETLTCFEDAVKLEEEISKLNVEIAERTDYESDDYMRLIHSLTEKSERHELIGGSKRNADAEVVLKGLSCLLNAYCANPRFFCSTNLPTTLILSRFSGSKIISKITPERWF